PGMWSPDGSGSGSGLRPMTDIRIVLVGAKGSGKSSTFNTILGRADMPPFSRTSRCRVGDGVVFGRHVTVVDTPGWWRNYFCHETPVLDRRELVLALSRCPPGPHVFLLVVRVDRSFGETNRRAAQEHVELLGEGVWARALVVFSFGDWLGAATAERYLETEGTALRWLVDRCSNRYHVINNRTRGDGFQVRELIGKIEETVAGGNGNWHYEVERRVTETLERRKRRGGEAEGGEEEEEGGAEEEGSDSDG
uniref:AIG1-type G domain-containing protein n=1 Tax=Sphaeramia orbicularis TaxID=375764 RepID=A0A672YM18_9TELE